MASGGPHFLSEPSENLLCCPVCCEDFDQASHSPRILPCFHSFCESCLDKLVEDGLCQCPTCRRVSPVEGRAPLTTITVRPLDMESPAQSLEGVSCKVCTRGGLVTSRCQDCEEFLCLHCSIAHSRLKISRDHLLVPASEVIESPDELLRPSNKCERHKDKKLELYCVSCCTAVCAICALTLHRKCEQLVEVDSIVDDKKKEILTLCGKLEEVQQSFQAKAQEVEASVEAVQSNLKDAEDKTDKIFMEIISSAKKRWVKVLKRLRAQAKSDQLQLEEQAATFRSLQADAHTAAHYGRQCVSNSLVMEVLKKNPELEKTMCELKKELSAAVKPAPKYEILAEKMLDLKSLLMEIECLSSTAVPAGVQVLPVSLASIQLDPSVCGSGCWVGADQCSLSNQPCPHRQRQWQSRVLRGPASCGTVALPGTSSYWQVRTLATPKPQIKEYEDLCEFGVASLQALHTWDGSRVIGATVRDAFTVVIYTDSDQVRAAAYYSQRCLSYTVLAPLPPDTPVDQTLGLLLDTATSRLHVIDVRATRVLWSRDIDLSTPVWPVVRVWPEKESGAGVEVEVQSGPQIKMTGKMVRLLQSVLGGSVSRLERTESCWEEEKKEKDNDDVDDDEDDDNDVYYYDYYDYYNYKDNDY